MKIETGDIGFPGRIKKSSLIQPPSSAELGKYPQLTTMDGEEWTRRTWILLLLIVSLPIAALRPGAVTADGGYTMKIVGLQATLDNSGWMIQNIELRLLAVWASSSPLSSKAKGGIKSVQQVTNCHIDHILSNRTTTKSKHCKHLHLTNEERKTQRSHKFPRAY